MIEGIHIIDDVIPKSYQDEIERVMFDDAQWMLRYDVTYEKSSFLKLQKHRPGLKPRPGFHHALVHNYNVSSPITNFLRPLIFYGLEKINYKLESISLGRSFLQLPIQEGLHEDTKDPLHVDSYSPHMVFLYYVVSSDGETLISDCKSDWSDDSNTIQEYTYDRCKIVERVTPKKGRLVMFDGSHYHAAEQSKKDIRCIINFNLQVSKND
jgi:hypothetical protein